MRPHARVLIGALLVLVVIVTAIVWTTRSNAPVPQYQNRVAIPGTSPHPISLWIDPSPATVGSTQLTAQVGDPSGMPLGVSSIAFFVYPDGAFPSDELPGTYIADAPIQDFLGTGHGYTTTAEFDQPGIWNVEVHFQLGDVERFTTFEIEVTS
jgi:hypothetical protein